MQTRLRRQVIYQYDGIYVVRAMWDTEWNETDAPPPQNASNHTSFLMRWISVKADGQKLPGRHALVYNKLSIHELWKQC